MMRCSAYLALDIAKWIGTACGVTGATLIALNLGVVVRFLRSTVLRLS
jgi:hypothetical protein